MSSQSASGVVMVTGCVSSDSGCTTVHANAATDVPARLEALGALAGLSRAALTAQAASAVDAIVHLRRDHGVRRVAEVAGVVRGAGAVEHAGLVVRTALAVGPDGRVRTGPGWPALAERVGVPAPGVP